MPPPRDAPGSLQHRNQQHQDDNKHDDGNHLLALPRGTRDPPDLSAGAVEARGVAVDEGLLVLEECDLVVELVADLHAQLALAADGLAQAVELVVLLAQDPAVVRVHLHVVREALGRVAVALGAVRVVAVRLVEELG